MISIDIAILLLILQNTSQYNKNYYINMIKSSEQCEYKVKSLITIASPINDILFILTNLSLRYFYYFLLINSKIETNGNLILFQ